MAELSPIETERTIIRPFKEAFITPRYIGWLNDLEVVRFSQQRLRTHTEESCVDFYQRFAGSPHHFSAIFAKDEALGHIGNVSITVDASNKVADIAILIGEKQVWGQGYGLEVWKAVMEALLADGVRLVTGGCMANNKAMVKVMEKAGMRHYYTRQGYFLFEGQPVDSVHYVRGIGNGN